jgi:OOP family OmpA-OmpF porin
MCFAFGCAQRQALFVVLPNPDGSSGAITVSDGQQSVLLDKPYAASEEKRGSVAATTTDSQQVQQIFGGALAAEPILPRHFRLYFLNDTDKMTPESKQQYRAVFDDIKRRPVYQVEVIGYTDTVGDESYNQQLSLKRAEAIRDKLIRDGLNPDSISVAGRGDLDPAVPTAPQTPEARNRRVEITVR